MEKNEAKQATGGAAENFVDLLNIETVLVEDKRVVVRMKTVKPLLQPLGFLHGGATLSLLETAASVGAAHSSDFDEKPFGVHVDIHHRHSGLLGDIITGTAVLEHDPSLAPQKPDRRTQLWKVTACNQDGVLISEGHVEVRIVRAL